MGESSGKADIQCPSDLHRPPSSILPSLPLHSLLVVSDPPSDLTASDLSDGTNQIAAGSALSSDSLSDETDGLSSFTLHSARPHCISLRPDSSLCTTSARTLQDAFSPLMEAATVGLTDCGSGVGSVGITALDGSHARVNLTAADRRIVVAGSEEDMV